MSSQSRKLNISMWAILDSYQTSLATVMNPDLFGELMHDGTVNMPAPFSDRWAARHE
jgi:hypothetical protein